MNRLVMAEVLVRFRLRSFNLQDTNDRIMIKENQLDFLGIILTFYI